MLEVLATSVLYPHFGGAFFFFFARQRIRRKRSRCIYAHTHTHTHNTRVVRARWFTAYNMCTARACFWARVPGQRSAKLTTTSFRRRRLSLSSAYASRLRDNGSQLLLKDERDGQDRPSSPPPLYRYYCRVTICVYSVIILLLVRRTVCVPFSRLLFPERARFSRRDPGRVFTYDTVVATDFFQLTTRHILFRNSHRHCIIQFIRISIIITNNWCMKHIIL